MLIAPPWGGRFADFVRRWYTPALINHCEEARVELVHEPNPENGIDVGFDTLIDRRGTDSVKWDIYPEDVLPMWVADMDFASPPAVIRALRERASHGVFGYSRPSPRLPELIVERLGALHDWHVAPEAIVFVPGIVNGFNVATRAFVEADEAVMIQTPVYTHILHVADDVGVRGQAMTLTCGSDGRYRIEFEHFEQTITDRTRMFLLCNPHNPVGRVFTRHELTRMAEICLRHDLVICSDEIHCDLIFSGHQHIPIASLDPEVEARTITLMAPSKTFNIAGLDCGFAVIPDADLRRRYNQGRGALVGTPNLLGYTAAEAAYAEGQPWLTALMRYLEGNRDVIAGTLAQTMPQLKMSPMEGTYLAWIDCRGVDLSQSAASFFLERGRVAFNEGATFGPGGEGFVRLNFGCPRAHLLEGLERMRKALATLTSGAE
jgi:cysteine-S-conjugate beta-lyase